MLVGCSQRAWTSVNKTACLATRCAHNFIRLTSARRYFAGVPSRKLNRPLMSVTDWFDLKGADASRRSFSNTSILTRAEVKLDDKVILQSAASDSLSKEYPTMSDIRAEEYENLRDLQSQEHPTLSDSKWKETLKYECAFCFPLIYHSAFRQDNTRRDGGVDNNDSQYHSIHHRESGLEHDETKGRLAQGVREREAQGRFILSSTVPKKKTTPRENIYNIANLLTFSRLIAAPVVGYMILHDMHSWAAGLFAYAAVTDLIDGWVARRFKMQTVVGSVIDPLADKSLMTITTLCLVAHGSLPIWLAGIILGRDLSLAVSAIYYRFASLPAPKTFARYWNFSLPSAEVHPTYMSKLNTLLQFLLLFAAVTTTWFWNTDYGWYLRFDRPDITTQTHILWRASQYTVGCTTLYSGLSYLWTKNAVTFKNLSGARAMQIVINGRIVLGTSFLICLSLSFLLDAAGTTFKQADAQVAGPARES